MGTTPVPGSHVRGKGVLSQRFVRKASMERPSFLTVAREWRTTQNAAASSVLRKVPAIVCCTCIILRSLSAWVGRTGTVRSSRLAHEGHPALCWRRFVCGAPVVWEGRHREEEPGSDEPQRSGGRSPHPGGPEYRAPCEEAALPLPHAHGRPCGSCAPINHASATPTVTEPAGRSPGRRVSGTLPHTFCAHPSGSSLLTRSEIACPVSGGAVSMVSIACCSRW